ncbi:TetR-like C-terminal domain-containing protein [Nocardia inohanensis]|uniref:TetR-like C-terminal domain-containing protein n=1 Tax=Nocardia inohanensis TaxID=209246 RepID=UPI00082DACFA|nr:TetR-like C-terminal domain-containing protein [Nocardia inohanensis]
MKGEPDVQGADRDASIADALGETVSADMRIPDTGSIEDDLRELARGLVEWVKSPGRQAVLAVLLAERTGSARPPDAVRHIFRDRIRQALPVVARAVDRGELPPGVDAAELVKAVVAPIYFRALITREQLTGTIAEKAVQLALTGARAGVFG